MKPIEQTRREFLRAAGKGVLGAAALTVSLFTAQVPASAGGFTALNNPLITALALLLLLGVTFLAPICQNKSSMLFVSKMALPLP